MDVQHVATLLDLRNLTVGFRTRTGMLTAVNGVSFTLDRGETLGIVGESGSGKTVTALAMLGLLPPDASVTSEGIRYEGHDLAAMREAELRHIRGNRIAMIFQEPMTSLNPVFTIGTQIEEAVRLHLHLSKRDAQVYAIEMLAKVGIPLPAQRVKEYPHHLSGGMRQRVMIAMALSCKPDVLIADEPTTALDVTIQAQIVDLMLGLQEEFAMGILLISHDMGLIAETCDRVAVMYAGQIVEQSSVERVFAEPRHPYTQGLLRSIPRLRTHPGEPRRARLETIPGAVANLAQLPAGCPFEPRCAAAIDICRSEHPALTTPAPAHNARCWLYSERVSREEG